LGPGGNGAADGVGAAHAQSALPPGAVPRLRRGGGFSFQFSGEHGSLWRTPGTLNPKP